MNTPAHSAPRALPTAPPPPPARAVRDLSPYEATSSRDTIDARPSQLPLKLDWNESTLPPSPRALEAIEAYLRRAHHLNWYPLLNSPDLIKALSERHGLPTECFLVTNGSDDALHTICATYLNPEERVVYAAPTYQHFLVFAHQEGARLSPYVSADVFAPDPAGLIRALSASPTRLCYLVSPNNPTGLVYPAEAIAQILEACPETLLIVDEAYAEFSRESCLELLYQYSNLVITRTFSKAYGLAACRVGYVMAHPSVVSDLQRVFNPKSVNALGQLAAEAALRDQGYLGWVVEQMEEGQRVAVEGLSALGLRVRPSRANFFLVEVPDPSGWVRALAEEGVYVRNRSHLPGLSGCVRVTVGAPDQMRELVARCARVMGRG
jgi:histidinol-phosphate aminotransferase